MAADRSLSLGHVLVATGASAIMIYIGVKKTELGKNMRYAMIGAGSLLFLYHAYYFTRMQLRESKIARTISEIENEVESKFAVDRETRVETK